MRLHKGVPELRGETPAHPVFGMCAKRMNVQNPFTLFEQLLSGIVQRGDNMNAVVKLRKEFGIYPYVPRVFVRIIPHAERNRKFFSCIRLGGKNLFFKNSELPTGSRAVKPRAKHHFSAFVGDGNRHVPFNGGVGIVRHRRCEGDFVPGHKGVALKGA